jgi:hypothetical protein
MQNEIFCVTQLRSSGEDHWPVARAKRVYDTRINRTESLWVQNMGPRLTHEGHATRNVSGVYRPRDVQESRGGRTARKQEVEGVRQRRHLCRMAIAMRGCDQRGHVVHPYQQLAIDEDITEGHDNCDNRKEVALDNLCVFRVQNLSIHARMSSGTSPPHM